MVFFSIYYFLIITVFIALLLLLLFYFNLCGTNKTIEEIHEEVESIEKEKKKDNISLNINHSGIYKVPHLKDIVGNDIDAKCQNIKWKQSRIMNIY